MLKGNLIIIAFCFIIFGCVNTEGEIKIKGKTLDVVTNEIIPYRKVVVEAILYNQDESKKIGVGHFISDSLGCFSFKLNKVKDAYYYNFQFVGDSTYASSSKCLGVTEMENNSKFINFYLNKLSKLTIMVSKSSKSMPDATLYLNWKSDGNDGRTLYPSKISNYGSAPEYNFKWSGKNVNSRIETRVFTDKPTIINWEIWNGNKKQEIIDTIICKRGITNFVNFTY